MTDSSNHRMSIPLSIDDLLKYHRESYKTDKQEIRQYILENESTLFKHAEIVQDEVMADASNNEPDQLSDQQVHQQTQQSENDNLQIFDLIIDYETLENSQNFDIDHELVNEYLKFQEQHKLNFLKEIEARNLSLKNNDHKDDDVDLKKSVQPITKQKRSHTTMNY